jgi:hypothetical protein
MQVVIFPYSRKSVPISLTEQDVGIFGCQHGGLALRNLRFDSPGLVVN